MLSGETAKGEYPLECITTMAKTQMEGELTLLSNSQAVCYNFLHSKPSAEAAIFHKSLFRDLVQDLPTPIDSTHSVAIAAVEAATKTVASAIICLTTSGGWKHILASN